MPEKRQIVESYQTDVGTINLRSDGITEVNFIEEYEIDVAELKQIQDAVEKISTNHPIYLLVIPGPLGGITKEAKEMPMFDTSATKAIAIITRMIHQRILGNIFFKLKKAEFTNYKLFKKIQNAEQWLKEEMIT